MQLSLKAVLIDLSGTLHIGDQALEGCVRAVQRLRDAQIPLKFASNTTKESRNNLISRLVNLGFNISSDELVTSLSTAADICRQRKLNPLLLLSDSAKTEFADIRDGKHSQDSIVIGLAPNELNYDKLNQAFRLLTRENNENPTATLIATHKAMYYRAGDGQLSLGPGAFIQGLEQAANVQAEVCGKPSLSFFEQCLRSLNIAEKDYKNVGIIGDDVLQDLGQGAIELGLQRFLVKTGKFRTGDEGKAEVPLDGVFDSFPAFVDALLKKG